MKNANFIKTLCVFAMTVFVIGKSQAQQSPQYTMYMFNPMAYNPAYAASKETVSANLLSRFQWIGLEGAPNTQTLSLIVPIKDKNFAVGLGVLNDKIGASNYTTVNANLAYRLKLNAKEDYLSFGLKGGAALYNANYSSREVHDETDIVYSTNIQNKVVPNVGFGVYYYGKKHYLGLSSPQMLGNKLSSATINNLYSEEVAHLYLTGGYVFKLNSTTHFKPSAVVKISPNAPVSFDINANFLLYEKIWLGAMYRFNESAGVNLAYYFNDFLKVGYAFDYGITKLQKGTFGSHELMIGFDMKSKNSELVSPRFF